MSTEYKFHNTFPGTGRDVIWTLVSDENSQESYTTKRRSRQGEGPNGGTVAIDARCMIMFKHWEAKSKQPSNANLTPLILGTCREAGEALITRHLHPTLVSQEMTEETVRKLFEDLRVSWSAEREADGLHDKDCTLM